MNTMATMNKEILDYLNKLKKNNNREWFNAHKSMYQDISQQAKAFFEEIKVGLQQDDEIEKLKMFRIYRDVRFSKDKTPYNPHFAGSFSRKGKRLRGGYYLRIRPGESFLAGGFWNPNKEDLFRIRKEFEINDREIRELINSADFKRYFGGKLTGSELKTAPKGFQKEHPAIDLIRKKGFIAVRNFTDTEVVNPDFYKEVLDSFKALRPYFDYMSEVLTTDLNGVSTID